MAVTDQAPSSVGVRNVVGGAHAAGVAFGPDVLVADFIQWVQTEKVQTQMAYDGSGRLQYVGKGLPGAVAADAAWQIQRLDYDASDNLTGILLPELAATPGVGEAGFVHVWANRAALTYPAP